MNSNHKYYLLFLFFAFSFFHLEKGIPEISSQAKALSSDSAMKDSELNFVIGYGAYINKDYPTCADSFFNALDLEEPLIQRARFYLALCQYYLKNNTYAAANLNLLNKNSLNNSENNAAKKLEGYLSKELTDLRMPKWLFIPYAGTGSYSANDPSLDSSVFFGLALESYLPTYSLKASLEQFSIKTKNGADGYNQTQWLLGGSSYFKTLIEYRARIFGISSTNTNYNNILAGAVGASKWFLDGTNKIGLDGYMTNYPNSVFGHMTVNQLTVSSLQYIMVRPTWSLLGQLSMNYVVPNAELKDATNSILKLSPSYVRYMADLVYGQSNLTYSIGLSMGKEIFGIHNDGAVLFSGAEEHGLGWNMAIQFFSPAKNSIKIQYSTENYIKGSNTELVAASVGIFTLLGSYLF